MARAREDTRIVRPPTIDETTNILVQLFNILLEGVARDAGSFRASVAETYNRIMSTLAGFVDFTCLHPVKRYLLEQSLMGDIILSHLEYMDELESGQASEGEKKGWLKLSGRTKALIAIAISECGTPSRLSIPQRRQGLGVKVESV